jgi:hypothetical protein
MTARIHLLSPDIRRPGRVGDLIIPVLDPDGDDRQEFIRWAVKGLLARDLDQAALSRISSLTESYCAAAFASLRSRLKAAAAQPGGTTSGKLSLDQIQPAIGQARRYQTLQALVNCTRRSLLPNPAVSDADRESWQTEIRRLEALGIR